MKEDRIDYGRLGKMRNKLRTLNIVLNILGSLFIILGVFLLIPIVFVIVTGEINDNPSSTLSFLIPSLLSFMLGFLFRILFRRGNPTGLQAMLICSLGWIGCSLIGALPFVISINSTFLNGFFEAMSGFTTTGITMFTGLDILPKSILFYRGLTQWIGGLGILTFFIAVTYRGGGAHMLFGAESHKIGTDRPVPGLANTLKILWAIYAGFTLLICLALFSTGLSFFDSICHSFTALSTGGFSPHDLSIEYYRLSGHPHFMWIEYILIAGMLLGGTSFITHFRILNGDLKSLCDTEQMKYWWILIISFTVLIFIERFIKFESFNIGFGRIEETFRIVLFQTVSIITTTGFATKDIAASYFGNLAKQIFLILMVIGGCVGSTGGGIKILRVNILFKLIRREIFKLRSPSKSVSAVLIDGNPAEVDEIHRVSGLFFAWVVILIFGGFVTAFLSNLDAYQSFSGMFSALGNIGPCYIPVQSMTELNPIVKLVYIFGMLAGRLEILPVLLLFSSRAWRA